MKNVVLIGASGFVGSAILNEALNRGHKVTAVVLNPEKITVSNTNLTVIMADATDPEILADWPQARTLLSVRTIPVGAIPASMKRH